eukprot:gene12353-6021_t
MKELKENSEKARAIRLWRGFVISLFFIAPGIPLTFISQYNQELQAYKKSALAWTNLHQPVVSNMKLFASATSSGSSDLSIPSITKSDPIPENTTSYKTHYFNTTSFTFFKEKTVKLPSSIIISMKYTNLETPTKTSFRNQIEVVDFYTTKSYVGTSLSAEMKCAEDGGVFSNGYCFLYYSLINVCVTFDASKKEFIAPCFGPYYGNYEKIKAPTTTIQNLTSSFEIREINDPFLYLYHSTDGKLIFDPVIDSQLTGEKAGGFSLIVIGILWPIILLLLIAGAVGIAIGTLIFSVLLLIIICLPLLCCCCFVFLSILGN